MTGCMVIVAGLVGRRCHEAAVEGLRAARPEDAALGQVDQTRNLARDGRKLPGALMDAPGVRAEQPFRVGVRRAVEDLTNAARKTVVEGKRVAGRERLGGRG